MTVFGTLMHPVTFIFILLELMMCTYQVHYYYSRPKDKSRLRYLILLKLLIVYNLSTGLLPDPNFSVISVNVQTIISYGFSFLVASYFPFYFYRNFNLKSLKFHAIYGVWIFLILPYIIFFVFLYVVYGNLDIAQTYGLILPFLYSIYLLWIILDAIRSKISIKSQSTSCKTNRYEVIGVYCAVFPWLSLSIFAYLHVPQWVEVFVANFGFVLITLIFMFRSAAKARGEHKKMLTLYGSKTITFQQLCIDYNLTKRETDIALLFCKGMTYKEIANTAFISEKTVDTHVQHIFFKTGAKKRTDLMQKLSFFEFTEDS